MRRVCGCPNNRTVIKIWELYNVPRVLERKNCGDLIIIPMDLAILEEMAFV